MILDMWVEYVVEQCRSTYTLEIKGKNKVRMAGGIQRPENEALDLRGANDH